MITKTQVAETLKEVMLAKGIRLTAQEANTYVSTVFQAIANGVVNDGEVRIDGLGTLKRKDVPDRKCRNPRTGEPIVVPAHKAIVWKTARKLQDAVNGK